MNRILKILCSIPVILITLYFVPFLGICLILLRACLSKNRKKNLYIVMIFLGFILLIPKALEYILKAKITENQYINQILSSDIYPQIISYSKLLIVVGIIFLILSYLFQNIFNNVRSKLNTYIEKDLQKDYEIREKNDLKMQEKREKSKNTHNVICPKCGANNLISSQTGKCKYCRNPLEYKEK